jgi:hypothetical protein
VTLQTPAYMQAISINAIDDRRVLFGLLEQTGVVTSGAMLCSAGGLLTTNIAAGGVFILGSDISAQGLYHVFNDATVNVSHVAADATQRMDAVYVRVTDSQVLGSGTSQAIFGVVKGVPANYPNPEAIPASSEVLAYVQVPGSATVLNSGNYTDRRQFTTARGGTIITTSSRRPAAPKAGDQIFETDTNKVVAYMGATLGWRQAWALPWGELGYTQVTSLSQTGSALADIAGASIAVTVPAGRKLRVLAHWPVRIETSADRVKLWLREGSTKLGAIGDFRSGVNQQTFMNDGSVRINNPSAGTHTYKLSLETTGGSGNWDAGIGIAATEPGFITVEDIGPV